MTSATATLELGFETLAERVDQTMNAVLALDVDARDKGMMLKQAVEDFHQYGLARLVQILKADERGRDLLYCMLDEPGVYALFAMHGLIRLDPKARAQQALESARPYMQSHGGDVEMVDYKGGALFIQLHGACSSCGASEMTLRNIVEKAVRAQMPEITEIVVVPAVEPGMIPLNAIPVHAG